MKKLGLYLHFPFCVRKCLYCDFYSLPGQNGDYISRYLDALMMQLDEYSLQTSGYAVDSVFLGGGTPSLMDERQITALFKRLYADFNVTKKAEVTIEANPGTLDAGKLKAFRKAGINRLSLGVQSFNDPELKACGRIHTAKQAVEAFEMARNAGFDNINTDIIFGLPGQSMASLAVTLNHVFHLSPEHVSFYGLMLEEGTPFYEMRESLALPNEDNEREMYFASRELLLRNGYYHYEISNFAKKDKYCRHNIKYWNGEEYLGIGPAAHSYFAGKRFSFKKDVGLFIRSFSDANIPDDSDTGRYNPMGSEAETIVDEMIDIPHSARIAEYVMLRFRLSDGVDTEVFYKLFGRDFNSLYAAKLEPFIRSGHIVKTPRGYAFSPEGMYVSNYILARIVDFDMTIPGV